MAIVNYMSPFLIVNNLLGEYTMGEYIESSRMNSEFAWATDVEIASLAHMLHLHVPGGLRGASLSCVYTYNGR